MNLWIFSQIFEVRLNYVHVYTNIWSSVAFSLAAPASYFADMAKHLAEFWLDI